VDNLTSAPVLARQIQNLDLKELTIVSPDAGGVGRARVFAKRLKANLAIIDKRRPAPNEARVLHVIGEVKDRDVVIVDDMVDTAGTLVQSVGALIKEGARRVFAACTHPVLSGEALDRIENSQLEKIIVTDTIPLNEKTQSSDKILVISVAELFGEAIRRISRGHSVSSLFV
jgi:ribose-phosphate pyrophosphokinase